MIVNVARMEPPRASVERALGYFSSRAALRWSITRPTGDRMLGQASLFNFNVQSDRADIGYGLAREHWQVSDEVSDSVLPGLLEHEWRKQSAAARPTLPRS